MKLANLFLALTLVLSVSCAHHNHAHKGQCQLGSKCEKCAEGKKDGKQCSLKDKKSCCGQSAES
ncbi:hypothetical protein [Bacteriovorax sp. BSW11_IV]|uniref:hypothetical protein n=1 Tax=Bacteriovorax sp. BSW11_IV TaxID=1353529 RepID=UPI00054D9473|nr:hypothetical protein [Bacteriovorax sp. BSW11_IV]